MAFDGCGRCTPVPATRLEGLEHYLLACTIKSLCYEDSKESTDSSRIALAKTLTRC